MRVAFIHYWLVGMRGGEKVLEQLCRLYPDADIFTHVVDRDQISDAILRHRIETTSVARLPCARRHYTKYLGFMPRALEELDLASYDLVISSESGPAKGVVVRPTAAHICYCHSPMRYLWDHYHSYKQELGPAGRFIFSRVAHSMRQWDVSTAARVDRFIANSSFVAERIARYYRRDADIVHPPVDVERFAPHRGGPGDYYLFVSELVGYKRADLAIEAFRDTPRRLVVVGDGAERKALEKRISPNIELLGRVSTEELARLYAQCRALIFPGEEDFGIVPVEAMASGRPVIAYRSGGAVDSVVENATGLFFDRQTVADLTDALDRFEARETRFNPEIIVGHARRFSEQAFREKFEAIVADELRRRDRAHARKGVLGSD
jgi:glycosyltransferase involved in cell wall biosynthesis